MRILALSPYHGGSHEAFLCGWAAHSRHQFKVLELPANKWKWRMRHGAITFADRVRELAGAGERWDAVFATDMLDLAAFRGLAPPAAAHLPAFLYMHENQLTYPGRTDDGRDIHFAFTNLTSALAAGRVAFNSGWHREEFLSAADELLRRMPSRAPRDLAGRIAKKSGILYPGVEGFPPRVQRPPGPLSILWAARWEHDKGFGDFLAAIDLLAEKGCDFCLSVIGQSFEEIPPAFHEMRKRHAARIRHWGWQDSRERYRFVLCEADVAVSTARHEFFGIAMVEAAAAGALPLVPERLAYPEVFGREQAGHAGYFYKGDPERLASRLAELARKRRNPAFWHEEARRVREWAGRYAWEASAEALDHWIEKTS